ncbi:MerC mercury resistance protein [Sphingomonas spermidinifaciens]|uniref:MerC mercury resistance protein n=1 Tax=Sphingomonas spermidinifaciens TaxID=1141889 RepID=A0A2A4B1L3_9SPHN|nr:MerC domain-containing protein [Sphingomonas spermidinifaciens]PCD01937.1 MerC mercury resistance protein [Sphingomonas spermidinifaciens]
MTALRLPRRLLDDLAIGASTLCLIHCLVLPALLVALPALTTVLALPRALHPIAFAFALPTSAAALAIGWRRHQRWRPAALAVVGLAAIGLGALAPLGEAIETLVTVPGSLLLAAAHVLNARAVRHARPFR